ncbi:hypothetical protein ABDK56_13000 [Sphingomonas sp. ASV193]|uniref:hypothetical protein n=1 Tax=Sphingomonas sp. ASV193 TaxID=3144405 RepID=UPI0032E8F464
MATAASAVAAQQARARRMIQHHFFAADAVRADRATGFEPANRFEGRWFDEMRTRGIVHEAAPGRYWLDIPQYDRMLQERLKRGRIALLVVLIVAGIAIGLSAALAGR